MAVSVTPGQSSKKFSSTGAFSKKLKKRQEDEANAPYQAEQLKKVEDDQKKEAQSKESVLTRLKNVIKGGGNFVHDAAFDVKNTAVNSYQGIGDMARGYRAEQDVKHNTDKLMARNKEWSKRFGSASDEQWKDPKFVAEAKKFTEETKKLVPQISSNTKQDLKSAQDVKAKKLAFQTAETFLNVAPVVGGVGKSLLKQGAKTAAKEVIAKEIVEQGAKATAKKLATNAAEGALFGAAYGATSAGKNDASNKDILKSAAIGGTIGAALPVVAAGGKKILSRGATKEAEAVASKVAGQTVDPELLSKKTSNSFLKDASAKLDKPDRLQGKGYSYEEATTGLAKNGKDMADRIVIGVDDKGKTILKDGRHLLEAYREKGIPIPVNKIKYETPELANKLSGVVASTIPSQVDSIANSGLRTKVNKIFNPVNNFSPTTQQTFKTNAGSRRVAEMQGRETTRQLKTIAAESGTKLDMNLAHQIEAGTAPDNAFTKQFREIADKTRQEAVDAGLDIGYKEDYVPHMWQQTPEAVDKLARSAGLKPQAGYKRAIPTYEEGLKLGLKPKYKDPAEMMGAYVKNLQTTRTNVALLSDLKSQGLLKSGRPPAGWATISAEGFPRTAQGNQLAAPKQVATVLNNLYGNSDSIIDKALRKTARVSSVWQDIALAGGVPHTPANFFTFSQMMKEGALGTGQLITGQPIRGAKTIYSPVAAFVRSFSDKQTQKFAEKNGTFLEELAKRGAPIQFAESTAGRGAKQAAKDAVKWDKLFNEPTFGRFMPNLQLNTAKNVQNALEKKLGKEAALDLTAETMKKMYGITDHLATGRSQAVQDAIGSVAFAPKYRESIVNVLGNTIKAVADPRTYGDRSYALNRRLAVGLGATYMMYDLLNKQTMGHGMNHNPEGKELSLAIPYGGKDDKGNQKVVYIPFMPSFMTMPRAAVGAIKGAAKGDMDAVASEGGKFLSMPIQVASQLSSNKDYFGRPIVNDESTARLTHTEEDSNLAKLKKRAAYVVGQASPAAVRAGIGVAQGKPLEQNLATAGEAPVRFGTLSDKSNRNESYSPGQVTSDWYDSYTPAYAKRRTTSSEVTSLVKAGKIQEAKRKAEEYNASLKGKFNKYYKKYGSNPSEDPMWDEMLSGLFIKTSERSFKAREKQ